MFVGIDVGGTKTEGVLLDDDFAVVAAERVPTKRGREGVTDGVRGVVSSLLAIAGTAERDIRGLGIGVAGIVDEAGVIHNALNLSVTELDLPRLLAASYPFMVRADNDVRTAALGAHHLFGSDDTSLGYLNLGTGVAAGLVHGGVLVRGRSGIAGEIGHYSLSPNGPTCRCGQRGCIEAYAGGAAIARRWPSRSRPSVVELFDAADNGVSEASIIRAEMIDAVYRAVMLIVLIADPDRIVLGGGTTQLGRRLIGPLLARAADERQTPSFLRTGWAHDRLTVVPVSLPVAAIGAGVLVSSDSV